MSNSNKILKRIIVVMLFAIVVLGCVILVLNFLPKDYDRVEVENGEESGLSSNSFNDFRAALLQFLVQRGYISQGDDPVDVKIRKGSVESLTEKNDSGEIMKTTSFLVDIDSIEQTFRANIHDYSKKMASTPIDFSCPKVEEVIYSNAKCDGQYGSSSESIRNNLPYEFKLTTGEKVLVKKVDSTNDGKQLVQVYLYSCDEKNPPIDLTEKEVQKWVKGLGDPFMDYYSYNIRTGYCNGDAI